MFPSSARLGRDPSKLCQDLGPAGSADQDGMSRTAGKALPRHGRGGGRVDRRTRFVSRPPMDIHIAPIAQRIDWLFDPAACYTEAYTSPETWMAHLRSLAQHPTDIVALKCMDGRINIPVAAASCAPSCVRRSRQCRANRSSASKQKPAQVDWIESAKTTAALHLLRHPRLRQCSFVIKPCRPCRAAVPGSTGSPGA